MTDLALKIDEMKVFLAEAIRYHLPILMTSAPGVGKSDVAKQACIDAGANMILSHPAIEDPTDVKGMPWIIDGRATFVPFGEMSLAMVADKPTVWMLDDLGQATAAMQAAYMQPLQARCANLHRISEHVTFIGATNRRADRAGVSGILEPVKSRFASIVELVPDVDSWCRWALDHDVPADLIAFLRFTPDLLSAFVPSNDMVNSPSPRTWANAARLLHLNLPRRTQSIALAGAVGAAAAEQLQAFRDLIATMPSVDAILLNPQTAPIPTSSSTLYAVSCALAYRATKGNFDRVAQYLTRLMTDHAEFAAHCVKDAVRRTPDITQTTAYVRLIVGDFGQLVSGGSR